MPVQRKAAFANGFSLDEIMSLKAVQLPPRAVSSGLICDQEHALSCPHSLLTFLLPLSAWVYEWQVYSEHGLRGPEKAAPCSVLRILKPSIGL